MVVALPVVMCQPETVKSTAQIFVCVMVYDDGMQEASNRTVLANPWNSNREGRRKGRERGAGNWIRTLGHSHI
jgi:hypothetical protein